MLTVGSALLLLVELLRKAAGAEGLYDDFSSGSYVLANGATSPNGKWRNVHNGFGEMGVRNGAFYSMTEVTTDTRSALAVSTKTLDNITNGSVKFRTIRQLKAAPEVWEVTWVFLKYIDPIAPWKRSTHHYYFLLKPTGWEFGKKDFDGDPVQELQRFMAMGDNVKLEFGRWYTLDYSIDGQHIIISLDGQKLVDLMDDGTLIDLGEQRRGQPINAQSPALAGPGRIGLYEEDSEAEWDDVKYE